LIKNVCRVSAARKSREPFEHAVFVVVMVCVVAVFTISATKEGVAYFSSSRCKDSGRYYPTSFPGLFSAEQG